MTAYSEQRASYSRKQTSHACLLNYNRSLKRTMVAAKKMIIFYKVIHRYSIDTLGTLNRIFTAAIIAFRPGADRWNVKIVPSMPRKSEPN